MTRLVFLLPLALLGGCIIYDTHGKKCPGCDDDGWWDTGAGEDPGEVPDAEALSFTLTPSRAEAGSTFIASLTTEADFDFATVQSVEAYGEVDLLATEKRAGELLLTLSVPVAAVPGTADLLLLLPADRVEFIEAALTIVAPGDDGTGESDTGDDGTGDDGTGDDGTGDDGTGDDGTGDSGSCP